MVAEKINPFFRKRQRFAVLGGVTLFVGVIFAILAIPMASTIPLHEYRLWTLEKRFHAAIGAAHPTDSRLLSKMAHVGNFGNSNHCDYIAGQFRTSRLSRGEIQNAYADISVPSFSSDPNAPLPIEVYFADDEAFEWSPWSSWYEEHLPALIADKKENVYLVFAASKLHPYFGDLRCS
jgi:hypothetical protein